MKQLKILMLLMTIALYSAGQGVPKKSKIVVKKDTLGGYSINANPSPKINNKVSENWAGSQALLSYIGSTSGAYSLSIGAQFAIDTTIGLRYDFTLQNGTAVITHTAIFYKFSNPNQSVLYNYLNHKATIIKYGGPNDSDPNVNVVGAETIDSFSCTHLQHGAGTREVSDYWMSPNVPGFSKLVNALKNISPGLPSLAFSGTIFNWGGLVRWTILDDDPKLGTMKMELHLREANTDVTLEPTTFDVPSK